MPAVAGVFYPADADTLGEAVDAYVEAGRGEAPSRVPKALVAPHAGYVYSGPVAGSAYAQLRKGRDLIRRVVLLGPAHRVPLEGLAASDADRFLTPLGAVEVDHEAVARVLQLPEVQAMPSAHLEEHSLEVHLPFLQRVLTSFRIVPLVVGRASTEAVDAVLEALWGGPETLIVVSSDLSHYLDFGSARERDASTSRGIERLDPAAIRPEGACGCFPIRGLLLTAARHGLSVRTLDLRSSGDTAGPRDQVVGYGAYAFE